MSDKKRSDVIDCAKGILILLVILGHFTPWPKSWEPVRDWIYFFHMPLFFGISGFLTNVNKLQLESWWEFISRSFHRFLFPWIVAGVVFTIVVLFKEKIPPADSPEAIFWMIVHPWYHLWFIPALFGMLVITKLLFNMHVSPIGLTIISIFLSATWMLLNDNNIYGDDHLAKFGDKRFLTMWPFFCGGIFAKRLLNGQNVRRMLGPAVVFTLILCSIFWINTKFSAGSERDMLWLVTNLALILLGASLLQSFDPRVHLNSLLTWMGRNTLPIYLWHVLGILFARSVLSPKKSIFLFWVVSIVGVVVVMVVIRSAETICSKKIGSFAKVLLFGR